MEDLWPNDLAPAAVKSPLAILKEQGVALGEKTRGLVTGSVSQIPSGADPRFTYKFYIESAPLRYRYDLFMVNQPVELYPVEVLLNGDLAEELLHQERGRLTANDEEEFLEILKRIFNAEKTRKVVSALLAQVNA